MYLECKATGSKPLAVTLNRSWLEELAVGHDGVTEYSPTVSAEGSTVTRATATVQMPLSKTQVMCKAENLASTSTWHHRLD